MVKTKFGTFLNEIVKNNQKYKISTFETVVFYMRNIQNDEKFIYYTYKNEGVLN